MHPKLISDPSFWSSLDLGSAFELTAPGSAAWSDVSAAAAYVPVTATPSWIAYQQAYLRGVSPECESADLVVRHDGRPVACWSLALAAGAAGLSLRAPEGPVRPPQLAATVTPPLRKRIEKACITAIEHVCRQLGLATWEGVQSPRDANLDGWHAALMERGAACRLRHELYVDLSRPLADIRSGFRKSYRPLIGKGLRLWRVERHVGGVSPEVFAEFRDLHIRVAGRVTRGIETWELQQRAIGAGEAFLIVLRDAAGAMVGGGLFHVSRDEAVYAVGAYDRDLFDQPLGHVVQMAAIEEMTAMGLKWYLLGVRQYPADESRPAAKELSISQFKEGFASHMFAELRTLCPVPAAP